MAGFSHALLDLRTPELRHPEGLWRVVLSWTYHRPARRKDRGLPRKTWLRRPASESHLGDLCASPSS